MSSVAERLDAAIAKRDKALLDVLDEIIFLQNRVASAERRLDALEGR